MLRLTLRWSRRDLRARWVQVLAIALILALGAGAYAGLRSATAIRKASIDDSFATANFFDLRVQLARGDFLSQGEMLSRLQDAPDYEAVASAEERLVLPTTVEATGNDGDVFVAGRLIGDSQAGDGVVNRAHVMRGELKAGTALIEYNFADHYGLAPSGIVKVVGNQELAYSGQALLPEYYIVRSDEGASYAQASFAVVDVDLPTAQAIAGLPGAVNDLILTVRNGADTGALKNELQTRFPTARIDDRSEDPTYQLMTEDVNNDQQMFTIIAIADPGRRCVCRVQLHEPHDRSTAPRIRHSHGPRCFSGSNRSASSAIRNPGGRTRRAARNRGWSSSGGDDYLALHIDPAATCLGVAVSDGRIHSGGRFWIHCAPGCDFPSRLASRQRVSHRGDPNGPCRDRVDRAAFSCAGCDDYTRACQAIRSGRSRCETCCGHHVECCCPSWESPWRWRCYWQSPASSIRS